jgi:predicted amidophosphoribosyltransferase
MASKKPRFFCDNCNAEVPMTAKNCPGCGRFFASVRCPSCGYSADDADFKKGCPSCGYSAPPKKAGIFQEAPKRKTFIEALPLWVYVVTALAFVSVAAALYFSFFR